MVAFAAAPAPTRLDVTVSEGTSMSVGVSPDGRTLAIDMQGSIWTLPVSGGAAKRITDLFNDARQPTWSPDGKWITFFGYRDGGYDIWAIAPDGSNQHKLTWGPYDDREPIWSHDGTRIAFSSDRGDPLGSDYNIWTLDVRSGELKQLTKDPADDFMPSWSADDKEIAFASARENQQAVWAVTVATGAERKVTTAGGRVDAPSFGPGGQLVYHVTPGAAGGRAGRWSRTRWRWRRSRRVALRNRRETDHRQRERVRVSRLVRTRRLLLRLRRQDPQAERGRRQRRGRPLHGDDDRDEGRDDVHAAEARLHIRRAAASARRRQAGALAGRQDDRVCRRRRHLHHAGRRKTGQPDQGRRARYRSGLVAGRLAARVLVGQGQRAPAALDSRHEDRPEPSGDAHDDAAAGCGVVAGRQAHRVFQRRRHVARRRDVGGRRRDRNGDEDSRFAAAARRADLVSGRQARRAGRSRAVHQTLPRRDEPDPDHRGRRGRAEPRQMVRADADDRHRLARRRRTGVVA